MLRLRWTISLGILLLTALLVLLLAVLIGSSGMTPARTIAALLGRGDSLDIAIVQGLRLARAAAAFSVGALLALAGLLLQALFRNPLADPYVIGVSGGASVGALSALIGGAGLVSLHVSAALGALAIGACTWLLGRRGGLLRLLLTGVVLASACGAITSLMLSVADSTQLRGMVFWLAGDVSFAGRPAPLLAAVALAVAGSMLAGRWLNVLAAGELRSASLGLAAGSARFGVFAVAAALVALAVLAAGPVGFVGLTAPHLSRMLLGSSDHRGIAPASALLGGTLLMLADLLARTLAAPRQLPVGAVTALVGVPLFLWLLWQQGRTQSHA
jgi:iron complex transport system permease protein